MRELKHKEIWDTVDNVFLTSGIEFAELLDTFRMTALEYASLRKTSSPIPLNSLMAFAERFGITLETLLNNEVDLSLIKTEKPKALVIRERYAKNGYSKCITVKNLLEYIEKNYGTARKLHVLKHFQVSEEALKDPERPINLKFAVDIGKYFMKYFQSAEAVRGMGRQSAVTNQNAPFAAQLREAKNPAQLYEVMFEDIVPKKMEKNYKWSVDAAGEDYLYLKGVADKHVVEVLGEEDVYGDVAMLFREGFFSSIPLYVGGEVAKVEKLKSAFHGDAHDLFKVRF